MTTGRINQVAILGHTSGPEAACSDSTLSARLRGRAPPAGGSQDPKRTRGDRGGANVGHGQRPDGSRVQNGRAPAGGHIVRHRVPAARRVAWHAPPQAEVHYPCSTQWKPANARQNGTMQTAARKHAVDIGTSGRTEGRKGDRGPRGTAGRLRPADAAPPPANGPAGPRRFRRRPHRLACNIPGSGRGENGGTPRKRGSPVSRRAPPRRGPRAAPPGTKPVGSAAARFRLGAHGFETLRIDTSRTRVRGGERPRRLP